MQQALGIFLLQLSHRYAGPVGHNGGNFFFRNHFCLSGSLTLPFFGQFFQFCSLLFFFITILRCFFIFLTDNSCFFFLTQPFDFVFQGFHIYRSCIGLQTYTGCCFINQIDCFVRQKPVGNITAGQFYCRFNGAIRNFHAVMGFIFITNTFQNSNGIFLGWFIDSNRLESTFQCCIFFNMLAVFVQCSRTDTLDIPTRQFRFQNIGRIQRAFCRASANQRVHFIDKEDYILVSLHFIHNFFQPFLKIASVFGTCHQGTHIQRDDFFILQQLWYFSCYNPLCQTFSNSSFPYAGIPQQCRIVLGTTAQNLNHSFNFRFTANHGINFTLSYHFI